MSISRSVIYLIYLLQMVLTNYLNNIEVKSVNKLNTPLGKELKKIMNANMKFLFFSYLIENDVCYLVLCERNYSKRLAYTYLEDIAQEFHSQYGKRVNIVTRPYTFIEFDTYIQKAKKSFTDSRSRRNMTAINSQLQDVQRIMVQNIDDVLQRGTVLSGNYNNFLSFPSLYREQT